MRASEIKRLFLRSFGSQGELNEHFSYLDAVEIFLKNFSHLLRGGRGEQVFQTVPAGNLGKKLARSYHRIVDRLISRLVGSELQHWSTISAGSVPVSIFAGQAVRWEALPPTGT